MPRRLVLVVLLGLGLATWGGCRGPAPTDPDEGPVEIQEPIPPSFEPIVFPHANPSAVGRAGVVAEPSPVGDADAGWAEKLELASGYAAGGFDEEALEVIRQTLALGPPAPWQARLQELRTTLRIRRVQSTLLRVDVRGDRDYVSFATDAGWHIRIRNVSTQELVLVPPEGASPSALTLRIVRRDLDIYAAELRREWTQTVFLQRPGDAPVHIPPGGLIDRDVTIPAADVGAPISGLRILQVGGTLRASISTAPGETETVSLPIRPGRVVAVPDGYEPLTRDPVASMQTAIDTRAPTHLLVAAEFVSRSRTPSAAAILAGVLERGDPALSTAALGALGLLLDHGEGLPVATIAEPFLRALERSPARAEAITDALARIAGTRLPPDARLWRDWWRRAVAEERTVTPHEESSR